MNPEMLDQNWGYQFELMVFNINRGTNTEANM